MGMGKPSDFCVNKIVLSEYWWQSLENKQSVFIVQYSIVLCWCDWWETRKRDKRFQRVLSHMVMPSVKSSPLQRQRICCSEMFLGALGINSFCQRWFSSIQRGSDSNCCTVISIPTIPFIWLWNFNKALPQGCLPASTLHRYPAKMPHAASLSLQRVCL